MLPKMGINRKMKQAVVYVPLDLGGIGYPYISTIQDQKGISHFVKHLQWGQEIGTELRASEDQVRLILNKFNKVTCLTGLYWVT